MLPLAILAGGFATRLGPLTENYPKCLLDINGRPFVDWQLELLVSKGFTDFVLCVSFKSELIQEHLGDGDRFGARIIYSKDGETQLGTGGAIRKALPVLGSKFGVIYGDSYLPVNYFAVEQKFLNTNGMALMTIFRNRGEFDVSNVEYKEVRLVNYEKGTVNPKMHYIDYGLSYFAAESFNSTPAETPFDLAHLCHELASQRKLDGFEVSERFYEIGSAQGIEEFTKYLREVPR